jgi:endo-alpha-1,4-polygalactosaminidase (GH114 family)
MATSTTKTNSFIPDFEAATERAREANERFAQAGRTVTGAYLDGIEKYIDGVAQFERKLGEQAKVEMVSDVLQAHAQMTQDLTKASVRVARELIAA